MALRRSIEVLRDFARLDAIARVPRSGAAAAAATLLAMSAVNAFPAVFTGRIVDALQSRDAHRLFLDLTIFAGLSVLGSTLGVVNSYVTATVRESLAERLRRALYARLLGAAYADVQRMTFGQIVTRVNGDVDGLTTKLEFALFPSIAALASGAVTLAVMLALDVRFTLLSIAAVAISILPARITTAAYAASQQATARCTDELAGALSESATLSALVVLRHPIASRRESERYGALAASLRGRRLATARIGAWTMLFGSLANLAGPIATLSYGTFALLHGWTTAGLVISFLLFQARLSGPFVALSMLPMQVSALDVVVRRLLEVCDLDQERGGERIAAGDVAFEEVSVVRGTRAIVDRATATLERGRHTAIVGPSGSGKSTLALLAMRLIDADAGCVRMGRIDLRESHLSTLRASTVVVGQDPLIFDATLRENLSYLCDEVSDEELFDAIETCALTPVVRALPDGLDTPMGQRGHRLSGGERQRVCVARALLARPATLILDEALTGVDADTEAAILARLRGRYERQRFAVITHRLHTARSFPHVIVMRHGGIVASGTHEEVYASDAWYRTSYDLAAPHAETERRVRV